MKLMEYSLIYQLFVMGSLFPTATHLDLFIQFFNNYISLDIYSPELSVEIIEGIVLAM